MESEVVADDTVAVGFVDDQRPRRPPRTLTLPPPPATMLTILKWRRSRIHGIASVGPGHGLQGFLPVVPEPRRMMITQTRDPWTLSCPCTELDTLRMHPLCRPRRPDLTPGASDTAPATTVTTSTISRDCPRPGSLRRRRRAWALVLHFCHQSTLWNPSTVALWRLCTRKVTYTPPI